MWKEVLKDFWVPFEQLIGQTSGISITEVIDVLDPLIGPQFFPAQVIICSMAFIWPFISIPSMLSVRDIVRRLLCMSAGNTSCGTLLI